MKIQHSKMSWSATHNIITNIINNHLFHHSHHFFKRAHKLALLSHPRQVGLAIVFVPLYRTDGVEPDVTSKLTVTVPPSVGNGVVGLKASGTGAGAG